MAKKKINNINFLLNNKTEKKKNFNKRSMEKNQK